MPECETGLVKVGNYCVELCDIACYNRGTCIGETCQCSQENGIAKYHGESCEMPGRDACGGSPCQNGGTCTSIIQGEIQVCFITK